jgi:uncharacterized protein (DUF697 family)
MNPSNAGWFGGIKNLGNAAMLRGTRMLDKVKRLFSSAAREAQLHEHLERMRDRLPAPVFWLFGKTQSGKTSLIKYLTGADAAEIGQGFRPCTRFSRLFEFPTADVPLLTFLDTRGLDEPDYDPAEDLERFNHQAHVVVVTVKALDHAQENTLKHLKRIRHAQPSRPVLLAHTCLHEAYPHIQHPQPYPYGTKQENLIVPEDLRCSLAEQHRRFDGLFDRAIAVDLTPPEEGFDDPNFGGEQLKRALLDVLPAAYRQTLTTLDEATRELKGIYARHALPLILGYSSMAATAGAIPVPWVDLLILPGIQTQMIHHLARFYGQPLTGARFLELASTLGIGMLVRQAVREVVKLIPLVGSVAGGALAAASTFALGKAFCYYYSAVHSGHVPRPEELRHYYKEELAKAEQMWREKAP